MNKNRDSAYKSWHITSTDINPKSFPKLNTIFGPKFEYSIAFHGWTEDIIYIGGSNTKAAQKLKEEIRNAIADKLLAEGSEFMVENWERRSPVKNVVNIFAVKIWQNAN